MTHTNTRSRLLQAAESLFIAHGYEAMSLRQITCDAGANLAAVNYHFGGKELLMQVLLANRLQRLNHERLQLLSLCEAQQEGRPLDAVTLLGVLFVPALRLSRPPQGDTAFMRLLGRVYSDSSPFIRGFLREHYRPISERFFEAFSHALPSLPRSELGTRLRFSLQSLSGVLAGEGMDELIAALSLGQVIGEDLLLARLIALLSPMLTAPLGSPDQVLAVGRVMGLAQPAADAVALATASAVPLRSRQPPERNILRASSVPDDVEPEENT